MSTTSGLHEPQPVPARVRAMTSRGVAQPSCSTAVTRSPLQTPLQLQTWASSGRSPGPAAAASASPASGSATVPPAWTARFAIDAGRAVPGPSSEAGGGLADGHEIDAGDLELGAHHGAAVRRV